MRLSDDRTSIDLRPLGYEFPAGGDNSYDDNWLMIRGEVRTGGRGWSFTDPCLLTDEARGLASWLRSTADGKVATGPLPGEAPDPDLDFVEPNLAFSVVSYEGPWVVVRIHLSLEARPPGESHDIYAYGVDVHTDAAALRAAADVWEQELEPFPAR